MGIDNAKLITLVNHPQEKVTSLIIYIEDIVVTSNNQCEIINLKSFWGKKFEIKDLEHLKYFLGIRLSDPRKVYSYPSASMF